MDTRIALNNRTELKFYNSGNGVCAYKIKKEVARGASCIVYEATYKNNSGMEKLVRIKECYPFALNISRIDNNYLLPAETDIEAFEEHKAKMREAFDLGNDLFDTSGLTNFTANSVDIYGLNNTVYVVTTYQEGTVLSHNEFTTMKDCIEVVKSTAKVIEKIHQKGYLYLDIKPENIFAFAGTNDIIQLFDFGSLVPLAEMKKIAEDCEYKISYTRGFSALELKMGNLKKVGKHTDVYAIGAVLFYLIFDRAPQALDCGIDMEYDFSASKYAEKTFQDKMYDEITEFFHHTLANYYLDRYQDMQQVISKLEEIAKLADSTIPYIKSSYVGSPKLLIGREQELADLEQWMTQIEKNVLFVTGMGGIGKSTLVRGYLAGKTNCVDKMISLNYHHSLKQTVADDKQFVINAVNQSNLEETDEYYIRKLSIAEKLSAGKKVVLVIDNFEGDCLDGIEELIKLNWKIIIVTRGSGIADEYDHMEIGPIKRKTDLYTLFELCLRRTIEKNEYVYIDRMIDLVQGHTLVLELIAKQIEKSFLTVFDAQKLLEDQGIFHIGTEEISYTKDMTGTVDSIKNIINQLFRAADISEQKRMLLQGIACFGTGGIPVQLLAEICRLHSKDILNELIAEGWLYSEKHMILMHPVILDVITEWEITDVFRKLALHMMSELTKWLRKDKNFVLCYSEEFLKGCETKTEIQASPLYNNLLFSTVNAMPRYREDYILKNAQKLTNDSGNLDGNALMKVYELIVETYEEKNELDKAYDYIVQAQTVLSRLWDFHIKGKYYYLWVGYYDNKLDGHYMATNKEEKKLLILLMKSLDRAIKNMKKSAHQDGKKVLAEYLRCKANILIRSNPKAKRRIFKLLNRAAMIIKAEGQEHTHLGASYYMTCAWYHTYVDIDINKILEYISLASEIEIQECENDLDYIDNLIVPAANILLESEQETYAVQLLTTAIELCDQNKDMIPFARKKTELYTYLLDVYRFTNKESKYQKTLREMDLTKK